ncbi:MAG: CPXCG motif-containing cysteine-rich protein [Methylotenera sp.]|nr:CPXCG motif-containing cysteine-rich protein [Oligoflexia bacterium]
MSGLSEQDIQCPFCGETITVFADCSISRQTYIEDCSVCCRPIQIEVNCEEGEVLSISTDRS